MTLPSIIDGTQAHYEAQRRISENAYAQQFGIPERESLLKRLAGALTRRSTRETRISKPAVNTMQRPPAFSK